MTRVIIGISVLAATGALAAILLALGITSPEFVLARAAKRTAQLQSVHVSGTVTGNEITGLEHDLLYQVRPSARQSVPIPRHPDAAVRFEMDVDLRAFPTMAAELHGSVGAPDGEQVWATLRVVKEGLFQRFDQVPLDGRSAVPGFVGKWYGGTPFDDVPMNARFSSGPPPFFFAYSAEEEVAWRKAFSRARMLRPDGSITRAEVSGRPVWAVPIRVSADDVLSFEQEVASVFRAEPTADQKEPRRLEALGRWHGFVVIDRNTYDLLALRMVKAGAGTTSPRFSFETMDFVFSKHNEPVEISVPERFRPDEEFDPDAPPGLASAGAATSTLSEGERIGLPLQPASSTTSTGSTDDTDGDGLTDVLEHFYGSDPNNPDSDGDGRTDGAEVTAGDDPVGPGKLFQFGAGTTSTP